MSRIRQMSLAGVAILCGLGIVVAPSSAAGGSSPDDVVALAKGQKPSPREDAAAAGQPDRQKFDDALGSLIAGNPRYYAGARYIAPHIVVYVAHGQDPARARAEVAAAGERWHMPAAAALVATAPRSQAQLTALHAAVDSRLEAMQRAGADVCGTGPDPTTGTIGIEIESGEEAARSVLGPLADAVRFHRCVTSRDSTHGALTVGRGGVAPAG